MTSTKKIKNGDHVWRNQDGKLHRLNGPAIIRSDGRKYWFIDGLRHRLDGPAVIYAGGYQEWWIRGNNITEKVNQWLNMNNKSYPFDLNTQILFKLTFGG